MRVIDYVPRWRRHRKKQIIYDPVSLRSHHFSEIQEYAAKTYRTDTINSTKHPKTAPLLNVCMIY